MILKALINATSIFKEVVVVPHIDYENIDEEEGDGR